MEFNTDNERPLLSAVSGSARQLHQLLRCINFVSKAHVRITKDGLRFIAEESQVMQGQATIHSFEDFAADGLCLRHRLSREDFIYRIHVHPTYDDQRR